MLSLCYEWLDINAMANVRIFSETKAEKGKKFESFTSFKFKERDNGGSMSRKQLTEILVKKFEVKRPTVASIISQWIQDGSVYAANGIIHASDETALAF